ncbi:hypothetical protein EVJ58_g837 [Rhodofomes roseus]|uniref:Superoxide dismutase [Cu-Zn] n=1 Tax=Rhodofomes roseus TaxID=34475 RepID=A0A4Y9Z416_9APHY|nr:hypothetical protein EVJ58_g837 [Rhodofomes roseus]
MRLSSLTRPQHCGRPIFGLHIGDLGNIQSDAQGEAKFTIEDSLVSLNGPLSVVGRAIVLHAGTDDLGKGNNEESLKTGNAGGRAACGIIGISQVIDSASVVLEGQLAIAFLAYKHADLSALSSPLPTVSLVGLLVEPSLSCNTGIFSDIRFTMWEQLLSLWYMDIGQQTMVPYDCDRINGSVGTHVIRYGALLRMRAKLTHYLAATIAFVITDELGAKHKLSGLYTNPVETLELSLFTLSASVVDIYITVTLCWHLRRMRSGLQRQVSKSTLEYEEAITCLLQNGYTRAQASGVCCGPRDPDNVRSPE